MVAGRQAIPPPANSDEGRIMGIQDIAAKLKPRVESGSFDGSVKLDTGGDGVIVINGSTISTADGPADCTIRMSTSARTTSRRGSWPQSRSGQ